MKYNPFGWIKTGNYFGVINNLKVRVRRRDDGKQGLSYKMYDPSRGPGRKQYWKDLNGIERPRNYYSEWSYLKKDGGED